MNGYGGEGNRIVVSPLERYTGCPKKIVPFFIFLS